MKISKELYGQDADGNRGYLQYTAELNPKDSEDKDIILNQITHILEDYDFDDIELNSSKDIDITDYLDNKILFEYDDFEFEEYIDDYFSIEELQEIIYKCYLDSK